MWWSKGILGPKGHLLFAVFSISHVRWGRGCSPPNREVFKDNFALSHQGFSIKARNWPYCFMLEDAWKQLAFGHCLPLLPE